MSTRPSLQFEDRFTEKWAAFVDEIRGSMYKGPLLPVEPEDGYPTMPDGEPACVDCCARPVRHEGGVCMACKTDHVMDMRDDY